MMRRLILVLGVMAIAGLMAGTAHAQFQFGMNYFVFENTENGNEDGSGPGFQPGGWNATTSGAIWISTGGATPVLNTQDLNFELDYRSTPTSPWIDLTGAYLLSNGVAVGDVTEWGTPGYWYDVSTTSTSPYYMTDNGTFYLPGTGPTTDYPDGRPTQEGMQFNLYAWTGDYNSYGAAAGGGAEVGVTGAFQVGTTFYWIMPMCSAFTNMPSLGLTIPGDANYDGKVDINDLTVVLAHYNQSGLGLGPGRVHRQRHGGHQRPDHRAGPLQPERWGAGWPSGSRAGARCAGPTHAGADRAAGLDRASGADRRAPIVGRASSPPGEVGPAAK